MSEDLVQTPSEDEGEFCFSSTSAILRNDCKGLRGSDFSFSASVRCSVRVLVTSSTFVAENTCQIYTSFRKKQTQINNGRVYTKQNRKESGIFSHLTIVAINILCPVTPPSPYPSFISAILQICIYILNPKLHGI